MMLGIFLERHREKKSLHNSKDNFKPPVSVIIPVHNEILRINDLLESLEKQDYENAEYIFIDDRSEDDSLAILESFAEKINNTATGNGVFYSNKVKIISLTENPGPNCKQYALGRGIENAGGEYILFTDADCKMEKSWITGMVRRLSEADTGAIIAPVFKIPEGRNFFQMYQCFEHGIRFVYLAGATGLGAAGGGFGNNLIFKKSCLQMAGGYDNIEFSATEDAALLSAIRALRKYKIRAVLGKDVHVETRGEKNWKDLVNQNLRWNNGGLFSRDLLTRINFNFLMITIGMGIIGIPLMLILPSIWPLPLAVIISMSFNSIANLCLFRTSLPKNSFAYGVNLLFTPAYFTFLTIIGFLGIKSDWKGKKL